MKESSSFTTANISDLQFQVILPDNHCFLVLQSAKPILELLAEEATKPFEAGEREGNLVESPAGHMMLKKIIAHDANRDKDCRYIYYELEE